MTATLEDRVVDWEGIVLEHGPLVWRLANRLLGNQHDAADCYQTVFTEAFGASQRQRLDNWPGFLTRLTTRRAIDLLRLRQRHTATDRLDPPARAGDCPTRNAEGRELLARLQEGLTRLPSVQAEAFCLRYFEQLSNQEIAARLTTNANRVGVLLQRARDTLRAAIQGLSARP